MNGHNNNSRSNMTRESFRRKHLPFYKRKPFYITIILIIVVIIGIVTFWKINSKQEASKPTSETHKIEKVETKKKTKKVSPKKVTPKKAKEQKVEKETTPKEQESDNQQTEKAEKKPQNQIKNAGTYNDLTYDTDWYTFKISNEVKLVKDANGDAALLVKYNYTNKTSNSEIPQRVQNNAIVLKQDGETLSPTGAKGDYAALINASNGGLVLPGKSFDGALIVKVKNTDSDVTMYFKNIQTNGFLDMTQPLKLK